MKFLATVPRVLLLLVITAVVMGGIGLYQPQFIQSENLFNLTRNSAFIALMAVGQAFVIIGGGIDLSVGSVMGLSAVVTARLLSGGESVYSGVGAGLLVAALCGVWNATLIVRFRLTPFVATLATLAIARSLTLVLSNNQMYYAFGPDEGFFLSVGGGEVAGFASPVWITLFIAAVAALVMKCTVLGRHIYAVGGSESAAAQNGVKVGRTVYCMYTACALLAGLAGILSVSWLGSVSSSLGTGYELQVIASAVLGGVLLKGGVGGVWGPLVGALFLEIVRNSLLMLGVNPFWQGTVSGVVIIVAAGVWLKKKE